MNLMNLSRLEGVSAADSPTSAGVCARWVEEREPSGEIPSETGSPKKRDVRFLGWCSRGICVFRSSMNSKELTTVVQTGQLNELDELVRRLFDRRARELPIAFASHGLTIELETRNETASRLNAECLTAKFPVNSLFWDIRIAKTRNPYGFSECHKKNSLYFSLLSGI
jgi:hypothetical protein